MSHSREASSRFFYEAYSPEKDETYLTASFENTCCPRVPSPPSESEVQDTESDVNTSVAGDRPSYSLVNEVPSQKKTNFFRPKLLKSRMDLEASPGNIQTSPSP